MARTLTGTVSSDKTHKTIVVAVTIRKTHPLYKKQYTKTTKFMAHDEANEAKKGDQVTIVESRPLSARKRFTLLKVDSRAAIQHVEPEVTTTPAKGTENVKEPTVSKQPVIEKKPKPKAESEDV